MDPRPVSDLHDRRSGDRRRSHCCRFLIAAGGLGLAALLACTAASAATIHVPVGTPSISGVLSSAVPGDTVLVGPGRYVGCLEVPDGVACIAVAGPDSTILDGGGEGPVVTFNDTGVSTLLAGFTITGGILRGERDHGAGILCRRHAAPSIHNNHIIGNRALGSDGCGGGIACLDGSDAVISNNRIEENEAAWGGGIYIGKRRGWVSSPIISANRIERNRARRGGGGISITHASEALVTANVIAWNVSLAEGGGGVHLARGLPVIRENTIYANVDSSGIAAAICMVDYAAPTIDHNIIAAHVGAPAIQCVDQFRERQAVSCNDVWNPAVVDFAPGCQVYPGNISADPRFCDAEAGNFGLRPSSPCVAHADCGQIGAHGIGCQEGTSAPAERPASADPR